MITTDEPRTAIADAKREGLQRARSSHADGATDAAESILRRLLEECGEDAEILNDLGVLAFERGECVEAEAALDRALALDPGNPEVLGNLAAASLALGMCARSIGLVDQAIAAGGDPGLKTLKDAARARIEAMTLHPRFVSIETASVCNAKCHFCATPEVRRTPFMPESVWKKIIDDNCESGVEFRLNMDGEPTLHKQLPAIVGYIKQNTNCSVTFNTNAERLEPALADALLDQGLDGIRISIDGFRKETYEKHRIGLSYNRVVANVLLFLEKRERRKHPVFVEIRMIRFPNNEGEREAFGMFWGSFPRVKVIYTTPYYWPSTGFDHVKKPCIRGEDDFELYYYTDGRATFCCMDWKEKAVIGDSRKYSTREIWNSEPAKSWRKLLRAGERGLIPLCAECNQDLSRDANFELGTQ